MRTLVDVGDSQLQELDQLSKQEKKQEKRSRAALIREAIDDFLAKRRNKYEGDAFGL
jgi:metal-responsive CopG/Arc/MetJ family transcriptional regulator